jgi:hypothetical protein
MHSRLGRNFHKALRNLDSALQLAEQAQVLLAEAATALDREAARASLLRAPLERAAMLAYTAKAKMTAAEQACDAAHDAAADYADM